MAYFALYHGSNEKVTSPNVHTGRVSLDFGQGFYLSTSLKQAEDWARQKAALSAQGIAIVNIYEYPIEFSALSVKQFASADHEWLDFIVANRNEEYVGKQYDIVIGPVANDGVYRIIRLFMNGIYDKEEAIRRFKTETLQDQFVLTSDKAVRLLVFKEAKAI